MTASVSHFRGHLFADLRGSTAFTERAGNAAGAELVRRFRQLVRDEVGRHEGAEVKTEGDAIYVVFPSASTAVMCGLAIVDKAAEARRRIRELPMRVGVGVHAGEAVEVPEGGYIGTAVNLAARVCSVADAGEVLVTGTVRGIARASIPVQFVPRGKRRLKGIAEPVELFLVLPEGVRAPRRARRLDGRVLAGAGAAAIVIVVAAAFAMSNFAAPPSPSPSPSAQPPVARQTPRIGPLEIGEYVTGVFQPPFSFTISDADWSLTDESHDLVRFLRGGKPGGTLSMGPVAAVYNNLCVPSADDATPIDTPAQLHQALGANEQAALGNITLGSPQPVNFHGTSGITFNYSVGGGAVAACSAPLFPFQLAGDPFPVDTDQQLQIHAFDVAGGNLVVVSASEGGQATSAQEIEAFFDLAQRLVGSISF